MPSRRKRKQERRKSAEATAPPSDCRGGWGQGLPVKAEDMALVRRAVREDWQVPPLVRAAVVEEFTQIALADGTDLRRAMAAIRVLIDMEGENQKREHAELRKPPYERNSSPRVWPLS